MLGSSAWRKYISKATQNWEGDRNWHDYFTFLLTRHYPVTTVEPQTKSLIEKLQAGGHIVVGFTARERAIWYSTPQEGVDQATSDQLHSLGIHLEKSKLEENYPLFALSPELFRGTFFVDTDTKGEFLTKLLSTADQHPPKILFFDDKRENVESVATALTDLNIECECYHYLATEPKRAIFDPLIANIQLYSFISSNYERVLFDEEALAIAKENPSLTAEDYLNLIHSGV